MDKTLAFSILMVVFSGLITSSVEVYVTGTDARRNGIWSSVKDVPLVCENEGYFSNVESHCNPIYYRCIKIGEQLQRFQFICPEGQYFESSSSACTFMKREMSSKCSMDTLSRKTKRIQKREIRDPTLQEAIALLTKKECDNETQVFGHPNDCTKYYACKRINGSIRRISIHCENGELFDEYSQTYCTNPTNVSPKSACAKEAQRYIDDLFRQIQNGEIDPDETEFHTKDVPAIPASEAPECTDCDHFGENPDTDEDNRESGEEKPEATTIKSRPITSTRPEFPEDFDPFEFPFDEETVTAKVPDDALEFATTTAEPEATTILPYEETTWIPEFGVSDGAGYEQKGTSKDGFTFSIFSLNHQVSIAICILLFILLLAILFFCCYLLTIRSRQSTQRNNKSPLSHKALVKKQLSTSSSTRSASIHTSNMSYRRYPPETPTAQFGIGEMNEKDVELKSITLKAGENEFPPPPSQLSTFDLYKVKNVELEEPHVEAKVVKQQIISIQHEMKPEPEPEQTAKIHTNEKDLNSSIKRKKVEIYIPKLHLPNVKEPADYARTITKEMEDEYVNIMESKELVQPGPRFESNHDETNSTAGIYDMVLPISQPANNFGVAGLNNVKIAHVSPYSNDDEVQEENNEKRGKRLSTFKSNPAEECSTFNPEKRVLASKDSLPFEPLLDQQKLLEYYF